MRVAHNEGADIVSETRRDADATGRDANGRYIIYLAEIVGLVSK